MMAGDSIRERLGGTLTSLMDVGVSWMEDFVNSETSATVSLLLSEPHETNKKTIGTAKTISQSWLWVNIAKQ